ncbi:hypothetical protein [Micromonospora chalcea]|uniref:hypothetical protein n=1 Tax=Micromonospora chalcea TaxID=1874 RepID=UPI0037943B00
MGASRERILSSMKVQPTAQDKGLVLTLRLVAYDNGILELDGIPLSALPQEDGWVAGVGVMAQTVHEFQKQVRARRQVL